MSSLATYLATPATGAASTTAAALISGLTPEYYVDGNSLPQYNPGNVSDIATLAATQAKYDPVLYPQPSVDTPVGLNTGSLISLNAQAIKDISAKLPVSFTVTTDSSGVATSSLSSYSLANSPVVALTVVNPASNVNPIVADITAVSSSSLSILTQQANGTALSCTVHVILLPQ